MAGSRKPPEKAENHAVISEWIDGLVPDLQPIVRRLDGLIREIHPDSEFALKWKKAYYGLPKRGWIIEVVSYDVSVNAVFLAGAEFESPPPQGERGRSRYLKIRDVAEVDTDEMRNWIKEAGRVDGWQ